MELPTWFAYLLESNDITSTVKNTLLKHRDVIIELGRDTFEDFLYLLYKNKIKEANELLVSRAQSVTSLADMMNNIASEQEAQNIRNEKYKAFAFEVVKVAGSVGIKILLTTLFTAALA